MPDPPQLTAPFFKPAAAYTVGHASANDVSDAALEIIRWCVIPRQVGGAAANIGAYHPGRSKLYPIPLSRLIESDRWW